MSASSHILILTALLGAAGMWLLLPRGVAWGRGVGGVLVAVAFALGAARMPRLADWVSEGMFLVIAAITVISAVSAVTFRNPVYCAIWFGQMLLGTAGLFLFAGAQFLAVATIAVYAGAILVTFLFVLMLARPEGKATYDRVSWEALLAAVMGVAMVALLAVIIGGVFTPGPTSASSPAALATDDLAGNVLASQHVVRLGSELFGRHLIAVEVAGTLLLVALVGAAVIVGQANRSEEMPQRVAELPYHAVSEDESQ